MDEHIRYDKCEIKAEFCTRKEKQTTDNQMTICVFAVIYYGIIVIFNNKNNTRYTNWIRMREKKKNQQYKQQILDIKNL